jgi:hypothetical protein
MTMNINTNTNTNTPAVSAVSPEDRAASAVNESFDQLSPQQIDLYAGRGAAKAAAELIATVDEFTAAGLEQFGAAKVRRVAKATLRARYNAHCARR